MNNVVYIKHFDNGKMYVGITKHFEKRMKEHERAKDNLLVHNAMKKHKHYTEIVFKSECYDDILEMEKIIIQNFIDLGYNLGDDLYNMTLGGEGTLGCINHANVSGKNNPMYGKTHTDEVRNKLRLLHLGTKLPEKVKSKISLAHKGKNNYMYGKTHTEEVKKKLSVIKRKENLSEETLQKMRDNAKRGSDNHNSHPKEYYEKNPTDRATFKTACKNQGWVFDEFEEIYSNAKVPSGHKKFYYIYHGESYQKQINYSNEMRKPKEYYATYPCQRTNFKRICESNNWEFYDFEEVVAEECMTKTGRKYKKFYYIYKSQN